MPSIDTSDLLDPVAISRAETLGLGVAGALASAVPLFGILILPCATAAAGMLFVELEKTP